MGAPAVQTLEALVRDELREPIAQLVRRLVPELVGQELEQLAASNGVTTAPVDVASVPATTKVCRACGQQKAIDQ